MATDFDSADFDYLDFDADPPVVVVPVATTPAQNPSGGGSYRGAIAEPLLRLKREYREASLRLTSGSPTVAISAESGTVEAVEAPTVPQHEPLVFAPEPREAVYEIPTQPQRPKYRAALALRDDGIVVVGRAEVAEGDDEIMMAFMQMLMGDPFAL